MTDKTTHSALREWRTHMAHPITLTAVIAAGAVLGITGPFDTDTLLGLAARMVYWLVMVVGTYGMGALIAQMLEPRLGNAAFGVRIVLQGLATAVGVALVVMAINAVVFGWVPGLAQMPVFFGTIAAICLIVTAGLAVAARHASQADAPVDTVAPHPAGPVILERMPFDKRGPLVALSVEDHYVRITTTKGEALVLMRLSDAIRETPPARGAQVHRSHWAAFDQVRSARRIGDRAVLDMTCGVEIPVSRANLPIIKEAGFLPR